MPSMGPGDFEKWGKQFYNYHKRVFGGKLEVAVALQRHPLPIHSSFHPAGSHDLTIAQQGIFRKMLPGEIGLCNPGYGGHASKIYAPPKKNELQYVEELDKVELSLQRRAEMANQIIKRWKCLGSVYRKGAVHAYDDLDLLCSLIPKLVFWDLLLNQEYSGAIHPLAQLKLLKHICLNLIALCIVGMYQSDSALSPQPCVGKKRRRPTLRVRLPGRRHLSYRLRR